MNQTPEAVQIPRDAQRLEDTLRKDTWSVHEGLSEIVRDKSPTLAGGDVMAGLQLHARLQVIWDSGCHPPGRLPPAYFVSWAEQKRYALSWAAWAKQEGWLEIQPVVASLRDVKRRATAQSGIAAARAALEGSDRPVTVQIPRLSTKLAAALNVFAELCTQGKVPAHKTLSIAIDERWGKSPKDGSASTEARNLATLLRGDAGTNTQTDAADAA